MLGCISFGVPVIRSDNRRQEKYGICSLGLKVGNLFSFCYSSYCIHEGYLKPKRWARLYSLFSGIGKNILLKIMIYLEDKINSKLHELQRCHFPKTESIFLNLFLRLQLHVQVSGSIIISTIMTSKLNQYTFHTCCMHTMLFLPCPTILM